MRRWDIPENIWLETNRYPIIPPWYDIKKHISLDLITQSNKSQSKEQNKQAVIETITKKYKNTLQIYTDGSKAIDNSTGAAFFVPGERETYSRWRLNDNSCIVSAELSAIHTATSWLEEHDVTPQKVVILTDSKTSLHLISQRIPKKYTHSLNKILNNLLSLSNKGYNIKLQWIPSHCDIRGNDTADKLANNGRTINRITYPIELHNLKALVKKQMFWRWQQNWNIKQQNTNYGNIKPKIGNWYWYRHKNRAIEVKLTRLRLETANLNKYLNQIKRSPTSLCKQCNMGQDETTEHYLLHCQKFTTQRNQMKIEIRMLGINTISVNLLLGDSNTEKHTKKQIIKALIKYIKDTNRLDNQPFVAPQST